jgi:hypothetical protein
LAHLLRETRRRPPGWEIMMSRHSCLLLLTAGFALASAGCASRSDQVAAAYVSPYAFDSLTCAQLADAAQSISARAAMAAGAQDSKATRDAIATTAAIVIFWPAAFFVGGNDQTTAELARLRGEMEAIEQVSIRKRCGIQFQRAAPAG